MRHYTKSEKFMEARKRVPAVIRERHGEDFYNRLGHKGATALWQGIRKTKAIIEAYRQYEA